MPLRSAEGSPGLRPRPGDKDRLSRQKALGICLYVLRWLSNLEPFQSEAGAGLCGGPTRRSSACGIAAGTHRVESA